MKLEPIVGRYAQIDNHRIYFEEAGQGIPLLCLHTAGSDGRQYRAVLNDPQIAKNFRVIAFDMPWHGKSSPPAGWEKEDYRLTTGSYTEMIMGFAKALGLELDLNARGMGTRMGRFSMLVDNGVVKQLNVEAPGKFEVSDAATMLKQL